MILTKQVKEDLKEFETKVKEILSKDKNLIGAIVKVDYICKRTKRKIQREILI